MKTNSNLKRLSALILAGSFAAATASADATSATREVIAVAATTTRAAMPTTSEPVAKLDHAWLGAIAKDSHAPTDRIHRARPRMTPGLAAAAQGPREITRT